MLHDTSSTTLNKRSQGKRKKTIPFSQETKKQARGSSKQASAEANSNKNKTDHVSEPFQEPILQARSEQLVIAFWNLNGIRGSIRSEGTQVREFVEKHQPDILCLNETRVDESIASEYKHFFKGYTGYFVCSQKKGYAGVATYLKDGVQATFEPEGLGHRDHDSEGRVQTLLLKTPKVETPFYIVNTYVVNAGQTLQRLDYKVNSFNPDLYNYLNKLKDKHPVIWLGDLNVAHEEIDIWNSKGNQKSAGHTLQERESFGTFLKNSNWIDVFRKLYPTRVQYTYWSKRLKQNFNLNRGWRLDYFVVSDKLFPMCEDVLTYKSIKGSDHCPVVLLFKKLSDNSQEQNN